MFPIRDRQGAVAAASLSEQCCCLAVHMLLGILIAGAVPSNAAVYPGLRYASEREALLDLETPQGSGPFVTVVAVHGGGWTSGSRTGAGPFCRTALAIGLACAAIDYRLAPATRFPAQLDDVTNAVRFLLVNARKYSLDTQGVLLAGESAGAHLVSYLGASHASGLPVLGIIAFSPPLDLLMLSAPGRSLSVVPPEIRDLLGVTGWTEEDIRRMREASPRFAIRSGAPDFLIVHGESDALVPVAQSTLFCQALRMAGSGCDIVKLAGARHGLWAEEQFESGERSWRPPLIGWLRMLPFTQMKALR
jgi:acetyl esterase